MTPMTVRGLPRGLQKDAWWMAADAQTGVGRGADITSRRPLGLLILLIACVDLLCLRVGLGIGFGVTIVILAAATHWTERQTVDRTRAMRAWGVLLLSVIPSIDLVQFTSVALAWAGLTIFAVMLTGERIMLAASRLPGLGAARTWSDLVTTRISGPNRTSLLDWILPVVVGGVFAGLFAYANPIVMSWVSEIEFSNAPDIERVLAWLLVGIVIWPLLRLAALKTLHQPAMRPRAMVRQAGMINVRSVMRALVVFNVLFAAQTIMDIGYLWGGVRLPDGMTYATYAHRGAYPLMATALLAGGFALLAQPWLDGRMMRGLLLVWIAQTLMLVMSSILRLDLYVDAYGLTHLRFAAFVWMAVVALGLVVLILQIIGRHDAGWMLRRAFGIGAIAVYGCSLMNVAGYIARHQLTTGPLDVFYVCQLGQGAVVAVETHEPDLCADRYIEPTIKAPTDLRDWGFRNARLRHRLAELQSQVSL